MKTWIIGDIHGCASALQSLLRSVPSGDRLVFLGDYIDRGPDAKGVIDCLLSVSDRSVFLKGNHEDVMLAHFGLHELVGEHPELRGPDSHWLRANFGGQTTLASYHLEASDPWEALPPDHRTFFESLELYYQGSDFVAVHAGIRINGSSDISVQDPHDLMWIRWDWTSREQEWTGPRVYFGHFTSIQMFGRARVKDLLRGHKSVGIDTGCGYGGFLTAYCHETSELIQVPENAEEA